jgi:transcriptional regulator with XRE-family HTH domain
MPTRPAPSFYRRRVREALRTARESAHLTQREAAQTMDWSMSKLVRIEAGSVGVSITDLRALLALYGVNDASQVNELVTMARASKERPWFSKYEKVLSPAFAQYLGYEDSSSVIRGFQPLTVPGLLQTDDYARAIVEASRVDQVDERVELRTTRQELLERPDRPEIYYVLDEAALHRSVGGKMVMRSQLRHLRDLAQEPHTSIRIIPFSAGAHTAMKGSFTILEFADWDEDVLYLETAGGSVTSREDQQVISDYRVNFELLTAAALEDEQSVILIEEQINKLADPEAKQINNGKLSSQTFNSPTAHPRSGGLEKIRVGDPCVVAIGCQWRPGTC